MPQPSSPKALISYAHESASHRSRVRALADRLLADGVRCALDQYEDAPPHGWPSWISDKILDDERFVLVISSPSYLRRWLLAERAGVGLGAKYEGKLIRQVLYSQEGLNGRVIPVLLEPNDIIHIPPELRDTTRYGVRAAMTDSGYDALLRRLTDQPAIVAPPLGEAVRLLDRQSGDLASLLYILQHVPAPFPAGVLCQATGMTPDSLPSAAQLHSEPSILHSHSGDLFTTTYYRPVYPQPTSPGELLGRALDALLSYIRQRGPHATSRDDIRNALVLAAADGVRPDLVARVFGITQTAIKRFGDKRLVWRAATLSLNASRREPRHREDAEAEALALICGQSWVLQRVNKLEKATAAALESLALGEKLPWPRNTAFCHKCLGRLSRIQAEAAQDATTRQRFLTKSERYLLDAISEFSVLPDHGRDAEIGDSQSLLARTMLAANRLADAKAAAMRAESLLDASSSKDYQDLQLLQGDLVAPNDPQSAEDFYGAVIEQCARDDAQYSEIRARAYFARGRNRLTHGRRSQAKRDQLPRDVAQRLVAEHLHGAVVDTERVVEREFVVRQPEPLAAGVRLPHLAGEADQFLDHLRGLDRAVLVAANRLLQHLGERACLHDVLPPPRRQFALQQPLQQLDSEVPPAHAAHFTQEILGQDRYVRLLQPGRGEDVDHAVRGHGPRDDLADRVIQLLVGLPVGADPFRQRRPDLLEQGHVVADADGLGVRHGQRERLRQFPNCVQAARPAVLLCQNMLQRRR